MFDGYLQIKTHAGIVFQQDTTAVISAGRKAEYKNVVVEGYLNKREFSSSDSGQPSAYSSEVQTFRDNR
jgi:hypothetical protein